LALLIAKLSQYQTPALEDGFQAGADIPTVLLGVYPELSKALEGTDGLSEAFKSDASGSYYWP